MALGAVSTAWSCSCAGWPSAADAWAGSPVVFAGWVQRVTPDIGSALGLDYGPQTAWVLVEEAFKNVQAKQVLVLQQPGEGCSPKFMPNERYVFYLFPGAAKGTWEARGCHRTRDIGRAADDLLFLRALPRSAEQTRLSGTIAMYEDSLNDFRKIGVVPVARITITGAGQSVTTITNADGVYEVYGLPAGEYKVQPEIPRGLRLRFPMPSGARRRFGDVSETTAVLAARNGVSVDFVLSADTRITGQVRDPQGQPMKDVCVELESASGAPTPSRALFACTEKDGSYKLQMIPPGEYRVVANKSGMITAKSPFPKLYSPGITDVAKARTLKITNGTVYEGVDIQVPEMAKRVRLSGKLLFLDGSPVSEQEVKFHPAVGSPKERASTAKDGTFSLLVVAGQPGQLFGELLLMGSHLKRCPHVPAKESPNGMFANATTQPAAISGATDQAGIILTFPFAFCEKLPTRE